jgi:hypothetical protein
MRVTVLVSLVMLCGCASDAPRPGNALFDGPVCCEALRELEFSRFPLNHAAQFVIGPGAPVFEFPSGKSFVRAFELPEGRAFSRLEVRTFLVGSWSEGYHAFGPVLQFLDSNKNPLGSEIAPLLLYGATKPRGPTWTGNVDVPATAVYFVVFTKADLEKTRRLALPPTPGGSSGSGATFFYVPGLPLRAAAYGPTGELRILPLK